MNKYNSPTLSVAEKQNLLMNIKVSGEGNSSRKVGASLSNRIYKVFTSRNGNQLVI